MIVLFFLLIFSFLKKWMSRWRRDHGVTGRDSSLLLLHTSFFFLVLHCDSQQEQKSWCISQFKFSFGLWFYLCLVLVSEILKTCFYSAFGFLTLICNALFEFYLLLRPAMTGFKAVFRLLSFFWLRFTLVSYLLYKTTILLYLLGVLLRWAAHIYEDTLYLSKEYLRSSIHI